MVDITPVVFVPPAVLNLLLGLFLAANLGGTRAKNFLSFATLTDWVFKFEDGSDEESATCNLDCLGIVLAVHNAPYAVQSAVIIVDDF